ncbi:MAG: tyrosine-type recombinase/integrase [Desulfotomaculales bacterium]
MPPEEFWAWLKGWASDHTVRGYRRDLAAFSRWFRETGEEPAPANVTSLDLKEYQRYLLEVCHKKAATVNRQMRAVQCWLRWACNQGKIGRVPEFPHAVAVQKTAPKALDRAAVNRLLRELEKENNARDQARVRLMLSCGLRVSEVVSLRVSDLDIGERHGLLTVQKAKGTRQRKVPVPPETRRALRAWLSERAEKHGGQWLFPGKTDEKHLTTCAAWRTVKKYAWRARIPGLHPHTLRHTCATNLLRAGADLVTVAEFLGHARLDTTAVYTRPSLGDLARAAERSEV